MDKEKEGGEEEGAGYRFRQISHKPTIRSPISDDLKLRSRYESTNDIHIISSLHW